MHKTQLFISSKEMSTSKLINIKVAQQRKTSHRYAFERTYLMIYYSIGTSSKLILWIPSYASYRFGSFTIRNSWRSASSKNSGLKWHVIKYGLDWIGKTWTVSCDVMLGLRRMSKSSFTGLVVKKVSLRWDACLCIFCESRWSLLNEVMTDWIDKTWINKTWSDKTWINKTWSDKTWINKTLLLERTLRRRGWKLRMRSNSKKLYFSGYPSIQIPLFFSFCVTDILTSSQEVCYVGAWPWLWPNTIIISVINKLRMTFHFLYFLYNNTFLMYS